jgi:hypothetical protein
MSENEEFLDSAQAVKYLAERWGIDSYSRDAFRALRSRWKIKPTVGGRTATFWRKSDLDKIPKPDRSRPRNKRAEKEVESAPCT